MWIAASYVAAAVGGAVGWHFLAAYWKSTLAKKVADTIDPAA